MDPTSFPGPDTAAPAVEGLQPRPTVAADAPCQPASPLSDNWLSRAMALWLRDADESTGVIGQLSTH
jgi:hypothetical protein